LLIFKASFDLKFRFSGRIKKIAPQRFLLKNRIPHASENLSDNGRALRLRNKR
jgi:hypothetical protein